jgi:hypothetical protein
MPCFELELYTYENDDLVIAEVEYEHHEDSDPRPYGEGTIWEDTSWREIVSITYKIGDATYHPTKNDLKVWNRNIDRELARAS